MPTSGADETVSGDLLPYKSTEVGGARIQHVRRSSRGVIGFYGARARAQVSRSSNKRCLLYVTWSISRVAHAQKDYGLAVMRTDSTVFGPPFVKRFGLCHRFVVCLSVLPVCDVGLLWPNFWMDQDET